MKSSLTQSSLHKHNENFHKYDVIVYAFYEMFHKYYETLRWTKIYDTLHKNDEAFPLRAAIDSKKK